MIPAERSPDGAASGPRPPPPAEPFDARLVTTRRIAPSVRELVFERADGRPMAFAPGQWVNLVLPTSAGELKRAYSIASAPEEGSGRFELAVTHVEGGVGSSYLHALEEGAIVRAIGPHGLFTRAPDDARPSLFIGTGTGVTPLRSMMRAAIARGSTAPLWLLFGARHEADILYRDELERLAAERPNVRYEITLSQPTSAWTGRRGYVQAHLDELVGGVDGAHGSHGSHGAHAYICGLDRMVSAVRDRLRNELGFDRRRVHGERYD